MIPTKTEVLAQVSSLIKQLKDYSLDSYGLALNDLKPIVGFRDCKQIGCAGNEGLRPYMKLNVGALVTFPVVAYTEYASLNAVRGIHGFETTDWKVWLDALVLHEFAHVVQAMLMKRPNRLATDSYGKFDRFGKFENGHGHFFMAIYKDLRNKFLNDRIGRFSPRRANFVRPEKPIEERFQRSIYAGAQIRYKGIVYTVVGTDPKKRKYPVAAFSACGRRLNMPRDYVTENRIN